ncbi:hypothetical protein JQ557_26145 [Bradyrhizobium sp. U87765 SZCCT0131]|uniref:hypothetical protein n=1 Tax=unclassified Bradyrhizobium TaxID=2631580 RepID=UPI001BAB55DA|nr:MULTISPECIES: hypothetical protein [unclassified Bradyrhizobium]MBR1221507.1 hypothetical protein [Bradyrhizobium sp. U87765 SZCCT0131]MBR1264570.1 hypothetical protein [Bradyrhizobium sp. U87765 SZCCT0134]MBR1304524.1 hypothetical protein [Bradyrhizobium sp. U87765 SZCCT0110]MBR1322619.1 hypothetical protein [Bradyrhizobium sp. U87765 SZCCT0109]MBR1346453.1 hypothetical protein [Bradyrhizobium sp. U87765 SZCCT0048]
MCLIPFDSLTAAAPDHVGRIVGGGAKRFRAENGGTTIFDDEYDTTYAMPVNLDRIAVVPQLNAGDLLLLRGDIIHRTQDSTSNRVAVSFRKVSSRSVINRRRLSSGGKTKREMMKKGGAVYDVAVTYLDENNLQETTAMELLPHLHEHLYS